MTEPEVLDPDEVTVEPALEPPVHRSESVALAPRERRSEVIRPLDPQALVESFQAYQDLLPKLLNASDWQGTGNDQFVKKSGWRKIATAFDLDVVIIAEDVERDADGLILRSKTTARAVAPSGRSMDGDGYCTIEEFTGRRRNDPKLEANLRSTATTRAKNRAISDLVGMGDVSAEEVSTHDQPTAPPYGDPLPQEHRARVGQALYSLLEIPGRDAPNVDPLVKQLIEDAGGYFPAIVGKAILRIDKALAERAA